METRQCAPGGSFLTQETDPRGPFVPEEFRPEERLIAETALSFMRREVYPHIGRIEQGDHALMRELMRKAGEIGLLGVDVPEQYGGLGLGIPASALVAETINPQQSFALTHEAHTVIATLPLLLFGTDEQKRKYLPRLAMGEWVGAFALSESSSGSDALALRTRAELAADGSPFYVLNGEKMWITNTAFADLFTVFAKVGGDKVTAFLVERDSPGLSFGREEHKLGMHGTSTRRVIMENVRVPVENALGVGKGQYAAFCALNLGRFKLEAGAVGGMKELLRVCATYANHREAFGQPIAAFGMIKHKLGEMCAQTFALESMVYRLAGDLDSAFSRVTPDAPDASTAYHHAAEEYAIECNVVKVIGSEAYSRAADEAIQIHGGYGYTEEYPVARAWRDQRLLRIGEGANEIVRLAIVKDLLRRDTAGRISVRARGERVSERLCRSATPDIAGYDDVLDAMKAASDDARDLALFLIYQASERLRGDLMEAQEVVAAVADCVCAAYAMESVWVRCNRLKRANHPRQEVGLLAGQVAARNFAEIALAGARYALEALPSLDDSVDWRDEPFTGLACLMDRLGRWDGSAMSLRRTLADAVSRREAYPL